MVGQIRPKEALRWNQGAGTRGSHLRGVVAGSPEAEADCNVKETQRVLGLTFRADLDKYC